MNLSHPLGISLCQIVVNRNDKYAVALQRIQISRGCGNKRLSFTCLHLGNTSLVQNNSANELYRIMLHIKDTP